MHKKVTILIVVRIAATLGVLISPVLHQVLQPFCCYSVPFALACMFDDQISATLGNAIVTMLIATPFIWITILVLSFIQRTRPAGAIGIIALTAMDIICCVISCATAGITFLKVTNLIFSACVIVAQKMFLCGTWDSSAS